MNVKIHTYSSLMTLPTMHWLLYYNIVSMNTCSYNVMQFRHVMHLSILCPTVFHCLGMFVLLVKGYDIVVQSWLSLVYIPIHV